jgi:hypothetical protein
VDVLGFLIDNSFFHQVLEELSMKRIALAGKVFGVVLNAQNLTVRVGLNYFGDAIGRPSANLQSRSKLGDALMVLGVYLNAVLAHNAMHLASGSEVYIVCHFAIAGTMVYIGRLFARDVLIKGAAHTYVDELEATADAQHRHVAVGSQLEQGKVVQIAFVIHLSQLRVFLGSVEVRGNVFATGEDDTIELGHNLAKQLYIVGYRKKIGYTTVKQYRLYIHGVYRVLVTITQRDTNQRFVGHLRGLLGVYIIVKLSQLRIVRRDSLSLCLYAGYTSKCKQGKQ